MPDACNQLPAGISNVFRTFAHVSGDRSNEAATVLSITLVQLARVHAVFWLLLLVGSIAAWMNFARLQYIGDADSVVPLLVSLQRWTPFFWGQDRFGMLVPLIARRFHNPLANMLVQGWLTTVAGLLVPFLTAWHLSGGRAWFATGALANTLFIVTFTEAFRFNWYVSQPYGLSISLAVAGLLMASRTGFVTIAAIGLMVLAHWVNITVAVIVVPLALAGGRAAWRSLPAVAVGIAGGLLIRRFANAPPFTRIEVLPVTEWPHAWLMLVHTTVARLAHPRMLALVVALVAIAASAIWIKRLPREPLKPALIAGCVACVHWSVSGTSLHVLMNDYDARFVLPSVALLVMAIAVVLVGGFGFGDWSKYVTVAALVAMALTSVMSYGVPSMKRLRTAIDARFGRMTPHVVAVGATVVVGDYWTVWPAVFHANLVLYEQSAPSRVFGLTYRSEATEALWSNGGPSKQILAVGYQNDVSIGEYLAATGLPATLIGQSGAVAIYRLSLD
jgi:hypothetical protein